VRKSQHAHGVTIVELRDSVTENGGRWDVVRPSPFARRITARTPMTVRGGPAQLDSFSGFLSVALRVKPPVVLAAN
jgi:secreted PhoX family phosphatase